MSTYTSLLNKMIGLAQLAHKGQMYGDKPYTYHLEQVVAQLATVDSDIDYFKVFTIVAVGHDIIEDTCVTAEQLLALGFTNSIVDAIVAITKDDVESRTTYLRRCMSNRIAHVVKIADTKANLKQNILENNTKRAALYTRQLHILTIGE